LDKKTGILLLNLGTPAAPDIIAVGKYLREFLSDPRVIELPAFLRWCLVNLCIVPFRTKRVAHAYAAIWQVDGSPLLINTQKIQSELQKVVAANCTVVFGMRYGQPNIAQALQTLQQQNIDHIIVMPLFPQYSAAVTGSALAEVLRVLSLNKNIPACTLWDDFFDHPAYIKAMVKSIQPYLHAKYDYVLFSYHGLPKKQAVVGKHCYRSKCLQTATLIAQELALSPRQWGISFQSRLGKLEWLKPYTDDMLVTLRQQDIDNLLVVCPSFIVDCLETLEEIGIRAAGQWRSLGGASLQLIPCLNAQPYWIAALQEILAV